VTKGATNRHTSQGCTGGSDELHVTDALAEKSQLCTVGPQLEEGEGPNALVLAVWRWPCFQRSNGLVFDEHFIVYSPQVALFSMIKWPCFRLSKTKAGPIHAVLNLSGWQDLRYVDQKKMGQVFVTRQCPTRRPTLIWLA
jgi:hypothetical protein